MLNNVVLGSDMRANLKVKNKKKELVRIGHNLILIIPVQNTKNPKPQYYFISIFRNKVSVATAVPYRSNLLKKYIQVFLCRGNEGKSA